MNKFFRVGPRLCGVLGIFLFAFLDFIFFIWLRGKASSYPIRADWLTRWARMFARVAHCEVQWEGKPPASGILASNHLSYFDIIVFGSIMPTVFLAKSEVRSWPVVGASTQCAGTLFIKRDNKSDVLRISAEMEPVINAGVVVAMFLEGTSTGGDTVLPFRSSLLDPAARHHWPVTPAAIRYHIDDGSVADEICYWRDMTFGPHLLNLLSKKKIKAYVRFGEPETRPLERKELARELHRQVCHLYGLTATTEVAKQATRC